MTRSKSQTRNPPRTRRHSACYLHPADPVTGICASCLRQRLFGLDTSGDPQPEPSSSSSNFITSLGNGEFAGARPVSCLNKAAGSSPELRRCRSVFAAKCEASTSSPEPPRRKSCDVRPRNGKSLAHLFDVDDECSGSNGGPKVESKNILRGVMVELGVENQVENGGNIGDFYGGLQEIENNDVDEGEVKTMKEHIDVELQSKGQKFKDFKKLAGNIREAASVFSKKLQKWRQKQKKNGNSNNGMNGLEGEKSRETQSEAAEYGVGRRSCDTEPRFSVDGGRISFDEPRASWDGYLIARTIPRLAPMFSAMDNGILSGGNRIDHHRVLVDGQMQSIMEEGSSTSSGGSAQSNSDSSSSRRRSSFDRLSSVRSFGKKFVRLEGDYARNSPARLVITERELKDWHLNSIKDDHIKKFESKSNLGSMTVENGSSLGSKKPLRWRKMWNVFGFKQKSCEKLEKEVDNREVKDSTGWKLMRSNSIVGARRSCEVVKLSNSTSTMSLADGADCASWSREDFLVGRKQSAKYASSNLEDGVSPLYLTPLRSSRSRISGRNKLQNSHFGYGNILQLN